MSDVPESNDPPRPESVPFGIILVLVGAYIGVGHTWLTGKTHWMLPVVGVIVVAVGLSYIAPALGRGGHMLDKFTVACVALALNYAVFIAGLDWLKSLGGVWGPRLVRIAVVAVDLYLVFWLAKALLRIEGHRLAGVVGSVLVASALHAAGVLDRIGFSSRLLPPISSGYLEARRLGEKYPDLPLQDFAGTWATPINMFGQGWITRVAVRIDGGKPRATLWRACGRSECEAGSYQGVIESRSAGKAQAVHFAGQNDGVHWIASLMVVGSGISLYEQRIRGTNQNTNQQQGGPPWKRIAP